MPISCVTSQEVRAQSLAPSNALVSSTSSPDITNLTSAPPGIDVLGSCEEESSCSTTTTDSVSVSNRASASCSTSEGSLVNGGYIKFAVSCLTSSEGFTSEFQDAGCLNELSSMGMFKHYMVHNK